MLTIRFGQREWQFDETTPLSMGEVVMLREAGVSALEFGQFLIGLSTREVSGLRDDEVLQFGEAVARIAFLAEARQNHEVRWRDFIWTISIDDLQNFDFTVGEEPGEAAAATSSPAAPAAGVGAALAAVQSPTKATKKAPTKRATTRKSPRAAARS